VQKLVSLDAKQDVSVRGRRGVWWICRSTCAAATRVVSAYFLCQREDGERSTAMPSTATAKRQPRYVRVYHTSRIFSPEREYYESTFSVDREIHFSVSTISAATRCKLQVFCTLERMQQRVNHIVPCQEKHELYVRDSRDLPRTIVH
jgi:hypothetical protein